MKTLFSINADKISILDEDKLIFKVDDKYFVDKTGNEVTLSEDYINLKKERENNNHNVDAYEDYYDLDDDFKYHDYKEGLMPESTIELEWSYDEPFGNFGYKNKEGEFVIKPQYAWAHHFSYGLASVNLTRTWYKGENGHEYYENHWGYIDKKGKTVIPFSYDGAYDFNKYGVAVVTKYINSDDLGILIDTEGKQVKGTEKMNVSYVYDADDRFFEFSYLDGKYIKNNKEFYDDSEEYFGIYDTKERKIVIEPSYQLFNFSEVKENLIQVSERREMELGIRNHYEYYIDSEGKEVYPGLKDMNFDFVELVFEKEKFLIVQKREFIELQDEKVSMVYPYNGKEYTEKHTYGLYSEKGKLLIDTVYDSINKVSKGIYSCRKDGILDIIQTEDND